MSGDVIPFAKPLPMCMHCGNRRAGAGIFCTTCAKSGVADDFATCLEPGCNTVKKTRVPGQKWYWCPKHKQEGLI